MEQAINTTQQATHIMIGVSSDTIICLSVGTIEDLSEKKQKYVAICEPTGVKVMIVSISENLVDKESGAIITDTSVLTEEYKYLIEI